jgi:hypothetical protein
MRVALAGYAIGARSVLGDQMSAATQVLTIEVRLAVG